MRAGDGDDEETPVGRVVSVVHRIPGGAAPGEVSVRIRGGTEFYMAFCDVPVEAGSEVLVVSDRGGRALGVVAAG